MGIWKDRIQLNLNRLMDESELSQADLARLVGSSPSNVSRWCSGKASPELWMLEKMTELIGWSPDEFTKMATGESAVPKTTKLHEIQSLKVLAERLNYDIRFKKLPPN